jgi:outer membrane receptor protein involved in Fe transport
MKHLFTLALIAMAYVVMAQPVSPGKGINTVKGVIVEKDMKTPVEYAAVAAVKTESDSIISAMLTDEKGEFLLEVPHQYSKIKLEVTFVGFRSIENIVDLGRNATLIDLGKIILEPDMQMLEEVEITSEKATMNLYVDRKVYNVEKDLSARGGTGEDVLKNVPGVELDAEGNVTVRNAGAQIFVDGRPSTLEVDKIPADQIEAVEVITNPSAKYDASSSGGIINIRLKKNRKRGYNGTASLGVGTTDRYTAMVNLNVNNGPLSTGANYSFNQVGNNINTWVDRRNFTNGELRDRFEQNNDLYNSRLFHNARVNVDYQMTQTDLISVSGNYSSGNFGSQENQTFKSINAQETTLFSGNQIQDNTWSFDNYNAQLYYIKRFAKPGRELSADLNYNRSTRNGNSLLDTETFGADGVLLPGNPFSQRQLSTGLTDQVTFQLDYVSPHGEKGRLETGMRIMYKDSDFENITGRLNSLGNLEPDSLLSNQIGIYEQVNAAYINYVNANKYFNYQAGFRFEHSYYIGRVLNSETTFSYAYPSTLANVWKAIFPSVFISRKYSKNAEIQANFSRKIGRPSFWQLNPTININDPRNLRFGNPELRPEFINLAEINHSLSGNKGNWLITLYGRLTEDPITWVNFPFEGDPDILVTTSVNGTFDFTYGVENIWKWLITKKMDLTLSANTYMVNVRSNTPQGEFSNTGFTYDIKPNITYRFPKDFTLQVSGNYRSPRILPQGYTQPYYFMDISLAKRINKSWNINLIVSDVFDSKQWGQIFDTPAYFQDANRRREARYARVTASYTFGKGELPKMRRRGGRSEDGRGGDDGDF